jgi:hypothetical protein
MATPTPAQVLVREIISREVSVEVAFVGETNPPTREVFSREVSVGVETLGIPAPVPWLTVTVAPSGDGAALDWSAYDEMLQHDLARYDIYFAATPFTNVTGMTPYTNVPAGTFLVVLGGLPPWQDRFFAVVPVDTLGGFDRGVECRSAYIFGAQTISREISIEVLFVGDTNPPTKEVVSREVSVEVPFVGETNAPTREVISREVSVAVRTLAVPARIDTLTVAVSPAGDGAGLDWTGYDELSQHDVARYDIYLASHAFTNVADMTPHTSVPAATFSAVLSGLTPWQDRYFAVVAVDTLDGFDPNVTWRSAYVLGREVVSREVGVEVAFVGDTNPPAKEVISREITFLSPDAGVPAPVTYRGCVFSAVTSTRAYGALDLDWSYYDEPGQCDVVRYRIYVGPGYFSSVAGMEPFTYAPAGYLKCTVQRLQGNTVYAVAVVAEDALGQWDPNVNSVYAVSSSARTFRLDLNVWLQGAYVAADGGMGMGLQPALPLSSPYAETPLTVSSVDTNVTDWIGGLLLTSNGVSALAQALWLRNDGRLVSPDHDRVLWMAPENTGMYLVLKHRNHLAVMSATPLVFTNDTLRYDFTTGPDKYYGGTNACVQLASNVWGMIAGDADGDGKITETDRKIVEGQRGKTGYLSGDLNLDGVVTDDEAP